MKKLIKKVVPNIFIKFYRDYKKQFEPSSYFNDKVVCPICNSKFRKFAPYGLIKRENAECPACGSLERHRLLWKYLNDKTDLLDNTKKIKLLHFAPEKCFYDIFSLVNKNIEYIPCDLSPEMYNYGVKTQIEKVDITKIPYAENFCDVVLCNHVLEHIPDDKHAMKELFRVMKKGAWGIFQVPIDYDRESTYEDSSITTAEGREKAFGQNDHVRWYGKDYKTRLEGVGFTVKEDDYVNTFSSEEIFKYGFTDSELIYYCVK